MQTQARQVGGFWLIAIFLVSFFCASSVVGLLLQQVGLADKDIVDAKYRQAIADPRVNLLFLGASLVDMGFDPVEFDAVMRKRGLCVSSYNLGIGGMTVPEILPLLKRLQTSSNHVHYVFLAPSFWSLEAGRFPNSIRSIDHFDFSNALAFAGYVASFHRMPSSIEAKEYWNNIAIATFRHYTNIGLVRLLLTTAPNKYYYEYDFREAFLRQAHLKGQSRVERFIQATKDIETYQVALRQFIVERAKILESESASAEQIGDDFPNELFDYFMQAVTIARTITPNVVAVEPPTITYPAIDISFVARLRSTPVQALPFLDFSDPGEYPELFEPENRYDGSHLNSKGAVVWSRLLADRVAAMIERGVLEAPSSGACGAQDWKVPDIR